MHLCRLITYYISVYTFYEWLTLVDFFVNSYIYYRIYINGFILTFDVENALVA